MSDTTLGFPKTLLSLGLAAAMLSLAACSDSDSTTTTDDPTPSTSLSRFVMLHKDTGDPEPEFLLAQADIMTQSVSSQGAGNEQLGWNFFYPVGNTAFVSGYTDFNTRSYELNADGEVVEKARFVFEKPLEAFAAIGTETLVASDTPRDGTHTQRTMHVVDVATGLVTSKVNYSIFDEDTGTPGEGTVGYPIAMAVRGDTMFMAFHKLSDDGFYLTPEADTAFVAVYDWPVQEGDAPRAIIEDTRVGHLGVNGASSSLIQTESGDIYGYSIGTAAAGFSPESGKPSGILKIAAGSETFDPDYFFDIDAAGAGGKLFWFDYIGNNMAIGRIKTDASANDLWSAFGKGTIDHKLVMIDLEAQTVSDVAGVPLHHKRYSGPVSVIDGKVYLSIETADGNAIYEVDATTGAATRGGDILGKTIKTVHQLTYSE
ncbi:MAG: DUF4374 domain-containing protein [Pseudomonadota bacterium]